MFGNFSPAISKKDPAGGDINAATNLLQARSGWYSGYPFEALIGNRRTGYRFIDTAQIYHNETAIKEALTRAESELGIERSDIHITTKIAPENVGFDITVDAFLFHLHMMMGLDYVDCCLIHFPEFTGYEPAKQVKQAAEQSYI